MTTETPPEVAPSELSGDQSSFSRTIGMTGLFAVILGVIVLILNAAKAQLPVEIGNNVGAAGIIIGMAMMLFHATRETDELLRRVYGYVGGLGLPAAGIILSVLPLLISSLRAAPEDGSPKVILSLFFPFGWPCLLAGLLFLIAFCRNETDEPVRQYGVLGLGVLGAAMALTGLGVGLFVPSFALTFGLVLAILGLGYLCGFVNAKGGADLDGYKPALGIGLFGLIVFVAALLRSVAGSKGFFVPTGLVLMGLGVAYVVVASFLVSDWQLIVMTRRDLSSYFYSPVAYLVLLMSALLAWISYFFFWNQNEGQTAIPEPVVGELLNNLLTIIPVLFLIPVITMRLISEEKRTGTYEVLVCAPVSETPIILSKVLAGWAFYMVTWLVWAAILIALRIDTGKAFDFRPLLSFYLAIAASGLAFVSMGVFFSSLTKNQIIAAVMTFFGMMVLLFFVIASQYAGAQWKPVFAHLGFYFLWTDSLDGRLHLRDVIIQLSMALFWGFLAVKALEARRWS